MEIFKKHLISSKICLGLIGMEGEVKEGKSVTAKVEYI